MSTDTRAALDVDTLADLHDAIDRIGLLRIERHLDCADPSAEDTARANLDAAIAVHVAAEVARALEAAPDVEAAIDALIDAEDIDTRAVVAAERGENVEDHWNTEPIALAKAAALRAAIAADRARAVAEARPTPDEARRLVGEYAAAHGALVLLMHGGQYDPFDDEGTRRAAADSARAAILRAMGVES